MSGKKALLKWLKHVERAPDGCNYEIGLMFDPENGWRVYQRIGEMGLAMAPKEARAIWATYDKMAKRPEWRKAASDLAGMLDEMKALAAEAEQKNASGELPPQQH